MTFLDHLATGSTTVCRCWRVTRRDGLRRGFTDHDGPLSFDGTDFAPGSGLAARAIQQGTGLAVDNTEALGVLDSDGIEAEHIEQGRYDGAGVEAWLVNWADPSQRMLRFAGTIGQITRHGDAFAAELRGLAEPLNVAHGRAYQPQCQAVLGDGACRVDLTEYAETRAIGSVEGSVDFIFPIFDEYSDRWFERGLLRVEDGPGAGLTGVVRTDRLLPDGSRRLALWAPIRAGLVPGQTVTLTPGCDKRLATCRDSFDNVVNFRGFPHIPGEDWLLNPGPEAEA
ncbi:DUF2163 domain-containing protein [Wenxinia saemankumensis]|uniref:Bacteriophage phiJL001 Gp84 C-terminal domain-containing protein n=1 Tax=Wenxinia saemankumensis TaxID=1447782 RepID=A0A1M6GMY0_9RHOB|nr:DUF2163 domain-containing protein [Wenxinia saemankumensis]SHJ11314.1 phage conserved hypothetical protein BR0599 [Wenxinia saemankumensis]